MRKRRSPTIVFCSIHRLPMSTLSHLMSEARPHPCSLPAGALPQPAPTREGMRLFHFVPIGALSLSHTCPSLSACETSVKAGQMQQLTCTPLRAHGRFLSSARSKKLRRAAHIFHGIPGDAQVYNRAAAAAGGGRQHEPVCISNLARPQLLLARLY